MSVISPNFDQEMENGLAKINFRYSNVMMMELRRQSRFFNSHTMFRDVSFWGGWYRFWDGRSDRWGDVVSQISFEIRFDQRNIHFEGVVHILKKWTDICSHPYHIRQSYPDCESSAICGSERNYMISWSTWNSVNPIDSHAFSIGRQQKLRVFVLCDQSSTKVER
jgi:hypothetical protein